MMNLKLIIIIVRKFHFETLRLLYKVSTTGYLAWGFRKVAEILALPSYSGNVVIFNCTLKV